MEMMADRSGTPTAQKYPMRIITSGVAPSKSGRIGSVVLVSGAVELLSGVRLSELKKNGGLVISTTPMIMKTAIRDLEKLKHSEGD